jgi:hypothetical protein
VLAGDVDRHVGHRVEHVEQQPRLDAVAATRLDQHRARPEQLGQLVTAVAQDADFGPRRVVLGQRGDGVEQVAAAGIVEEHRGEPLRIGLESGQHLASQVRDRWVEIVQHRRAHASPARRMPVNCQRSCG